MPEISIYTDEPEGETEWVMEYNRHTPIPATMLDPGEGPIEILKVWRGEEEIDWSRGYDEIIDQLLHEAVEATREGNFE